MRTISFSKVEETALCLYCKKNRVDINKWSRPCDSCKANLTKKGGAEVNTGRVVPAAVIVDDKGRKIFVDKFGSPVQDHPYDLDTDPRGYKATGTIKEKPQII